MLIFTYPLWWWSWHDSFGTWHYLLRISNLSFLVTVYNCVLSAVFKVRIRINHSPPPKNPKNDILYSIGWMIKWIYFYTSKIGFHCCTLASCYDIQENFTFIWLTIRDCKGHENLPLPTSYQIDTSYVAIIITSYSSIQKLIMILATILVSTTMAISLLETRYGHYWLGLAIIMSANCDYIKFSFYNILHRQSCTLFKFLWGMMLTILGSINIMTHLRPLSFASSSDLVSHDAKERGGQYIIMIQ